MSMVEPTEVLANPIVAFALRAALGAYVIYMARGFYADPSHYIQKWMPALPRRAWAKRMVRGWAGFCVWGGCFIIVTAAATQLLGLHGIELLAVLVGSAILGTLLFLPRHPVPIVDEDERNDSMGRLE